MNFLFRLPRRFDASNRKTTGKFSRRFVNPITSRSEILPKMKSRRKRCVPIVPTLCTSMYEYYRYSIQATKQSFRPAALFIYQTVASVFFVFYDLFHSIKMRHGKLMR